MEYHYTSNPLTSQFRKSSLAISFPHTRKDFLPVYYPRPPLMLPHAFYCKIQNKIEVCRGKKKIWFLNPPNAQISIFTSHFTRLWKILVKLSTDWLSDIGFIMRCDFRDNKQVLIKLGDKVCISQDYISDLTSIASCIEFHCIYGEKYVEKNGFFSYRI